MRIGIITFHSANNYGAVLQTFALSKILKVNKHDVELINLPLHEDKNFKFRSFLRSKLSDYAFKDFREKYLPKIVNSEHSKDLYIFGSDQIWNLDITKDNYELYFGSWLNNYTPRIAFAASFGNADWKYINEYSRVKELLNLFNRIGVRESSGVNICQNNFDIPCIKVLDPTMLISDYSELIEELNSTTLMACYIFGKSDRNIGEIKSIAKEINLKPILLNDARIRNNIKSVPFPSVSKWLSYLNSSDLILTDSFHCMVFAILFNKNFIAIPAIPDRIDRMLSLLKDLGLQSRFFDNIQEVKDSPQIRQQIDYSIVNEKLEKMKNYSLTFLKEAISEIIAK